MAPCFSAFAHRPLKPRNRFAKPLEGARFVNGRSETGCVVSKGQCWDRLGADGWIDKVVGIKVSLALQLVGQPPPKHSLTHGKSYLKKRNGNTLNARYLNGRDVGFWCNAITALSSALSEPVA